MFRSIWWRVTIPYIAVIVMATLGLTLFVSAEVRTARMDDLSRHLVDEATVMADVLETTLALPDVSASAQLNNRARDWSERLGLRVTIIAAEGTVLGESDVDYLQLENHLLRPEIQQALDEGQGTSTRFSRTLGMDIMYGAVAVRQGDQLLGFVRVARPLAEIEAEATRLNRSLVLAGGGVALIAVALATYVASRTIGPVRRLTEAVERMAMGDLNGRLLPTTHDEIGTLTRAFNHMADQLQEKVSNLALEQARLAAILAHMADGVIITDEEGRILAINAAAAQMLRYDEQRAVGRRFSQVAHSHRLVDLWNRCYESQQERTDTVESAFYGDFLHAVITPLQNSVPPRYLVMLQDLTHIRRLETIRRDFISNISHELRTPLASLALVVETLRDGAIEDPPAARRFLSHMETELASLTQMVEELLELSRIESGRVPLEIKPTSVRELVGKPVERLQSQAERKGVMLSVVVSDNLPRVSADAKRIEQVVVNLTHNAIKFTPPSGVITVFARFKEPTDDPEATGGAVAPANDVENGSLVEALQEIVIGVTDTGLGIPAEDMPRIFERFYKSDRARAQEGTGLGLAIAKHIVEGHGGRIWAKSLEGVGSTFCFTLPVAPAATPSPE